MVGASDEFRKLLAAINKIAQYDVPVLIEGETGTGKELVARALHYGSGRKARPFVPVNCGALPEPLIENELFGHRRGAFTDAREDRPGLVALAHSGTLFLDEVDMLPPRGQVALLRFLQDQHYRAIGDSTSLQGDVRIIAASNRSLALLCEQGAFRLDLRYRLELVRLSVPPLRDRRGDPQLLARHFVSLAAERFKKAHRSISPETLVWFDAYRWPGNVRELEHLVYREFLVCDDGVLRIPSPPGIDASTKLAASVRYREAKARAITTFETQYLADAMRRAAWNVTAAARLIGTDRRHLGRLLHKYGITRNET